ncbi:MAG: hypothetical protein FJ403_20825 [Verrucomicrobia bacterium]|nr:hypothetical protein [Verrucomicrobiota bacterium]
MKTNALLSLLIVCSLFIGCGNSNDDGRLTAKSTEQAASVLDQSFANADTAMKQNVSAVSEALRKREYEKAVISLQAVQQAPNITIDQGMAIQNSSILLERELVNAIERGDKNAERVYQLLKQMRRN